MEVFQKIQKPSPPTIAVTTPINGNDPHNTELTAHSHKRADRIQGSAKQKKATEGKKIEHSHLDEIGELGISIDHQPMNLETQQPSASDENNFHASNNKERSNDVLNLHAQRKLERSKAPSCGSRKKQSLGFARSARQAILSRRRISAMTEMGGAPKRGGAKLEIAAEVAAKKTERRS
ncbi:hypothetical protein NL676_034166 [Syzygium grande]|nr:hypothetical protein NL676_034166 [Syzygium grande]